MRSTPNSRSLRFMTFPSEFGKPVDELALVDFHLGVKIRQDGLELVFRHAVFKPLLHGDDGSPPLPGHVLGGVARPYRVNRV